MAKLGRNDPCPCGSGKKYKKCCMPQPGPPPGREDAIRQRLISDILAFAKRRYRNTVLDAHDFFWQDFDPEQLDAGYAAMAEINFWEWFIHDWRPEEDEKKTIIELYTEKTRNLGHEEKDILTKMNNAVLSLYEIQEVFPEQGLHLKDLLTGEECRVREKMMTRSVKKWDIFAGRILHIDSDYILTGAGYYYPIGEKQEILNHLKKCFRDFTKKNPESTIGDFLKLNGDLFNYYWYENIRMPFMPTLMTTGGEPMMFCSAMFEIKNKADILRGLKQMDDMIEVEEGTFDWLDSSEEKDHATILGSIRIEAGILNLDCFSQERLERGKELLLNRLGDAVYHKIDSVQDPYQAMENREPTEPKVENQVPPEVQQEVYTQYTREHYENWLNDPLPALNYQTPLETVKKPWGRKKVAELLKNIENIEERNKQDGKPYIDVSWLWERLGIER